MVDVELVELEDFGEPNRNLRGWQWDKYGICGTFKITAKLDEILVVPEGENYPDWYFEERENFYTYRDRWAWASDESYDVVDAYLFDYEYLYDAAIETLWDQMGNFIDSDLTPGRYHITADYIQYDTGCNLKPLGNNKYDGSDAEWIPSDGHIENFWFEKI